MAHLRDEAARWCRDVAGQRVHGTTRRQPLVVFQDEERHALGSLGWRALRAHRLAHRQGASRPPRGLPVCPLLSAGGPLPAGPAGGIGLGRQLVRIYHRGRLIKGASRRPFHRLRRLSRPTPCGRLRTSSAARRSTDRRWPLRRAPLRRALALGQASPRPQAHPPGPTLTPQRLDAACRKALDVDLIDVRRVERILVQALESKDQDPHPDPLPPGRFARPGSVFAHTHANGSGHPSPTGDHP